MLPLREQSLLQVAMVVSVGQLPRVSPGTPQSMALGEIARITTVGKPRAKMLRFFLLVLSHWFLDDLRWCLLFRAFLLNLFQSVKQA